MSQATDIKKTTKKCSVSIWFLILSNLLVFQLTLLFDVSSSYYRSSVGTEEDLQAKYTASLQLSRAEVLSFSNNTIGWNPYDTLQTPVGRIENLYVL